MEPSSTDKKLPATVTTLLQAPNDLLEGFIDPTDFYLSLLEVSLSGVILFKPVFDPRLHTIMDLQYIYLNHAAQRMLKLPAVPDKTFLTLYPNAGPTGVFAFYRDSFLSLKPERLDINYQHDGLDNYFHLSARRSGQLLVVSFTDTADHVRTDVEIALRASQIREREALAEADLQRKQLHNILMQAPAMICIFEGPEHTFKLVNEPYQRLVGHRHIVGLPIAEAMPELKGQPVFDLLDNVFRTGETFYAQEMLVQLDHNNDGHLGKNYYNFIYQAIRDIHGAIYGIMVFAYEVTQQVFSRKTLEENQKQFARLNEQLENRVMDRTKELQIVQAEAERQRSRLERFFMQAPAAICILDGPDFVYELVNSGYQNLFPGRALLGNPLLVALPEIADQEVYKILQRVYDTGETHIEQQFSIAAARHEGDPLENLYFNFIFQARHNDVGKVDGVMVFAFEITQEVITRQQAELSQQKAQQLAHDLVAVNDELGNANTQLVRTNKDLDNFIYTASHDLKAPMSNIEGLINSLRDSLQTNNQLDTDSLFLLELIDKSIDRFKSTIVDLTEISKVQKFLDEDVNEVDLYQIIEDVKLSIQFKISEAQAEIETNLQEGHILHFSRKNMKSIVYNLLSNAIKYRDRNKATRILITTQRIPEHIILVVQDNGLGISESNISKMFSMFKRFHDHVEGTGIGLYIVKRIVDNAGGKIEVLSEVGKGTTFKVYFKQ